MKHRTAKRGTSHWPILFRNSAVSLFRVVPKIMQVCEVPFQACCAKLMSLLHAVVDSINNCANQERARQNRARKNKFSKHNFLKNSTELSAREQRNLRLRRRSITLQNYENLKYIYIHVRHDVSKILIQSLLNIDLYEPWVPLSKFLKTVYVRAFVYVCTCMRRGSWDREKVCSTNKVRVEYLCLVGELLIASSRLVAWRL